MRILKYIRLYGYLVVEEDHNPLSACRIISYVRKLPFELKLAVLDIVEHKIPDLEINGVSLSELIEKDDMKPVRAILMLDWIRREPAVALRYMSRERLMAPFVISDKGKDLLNSGSVGLKDSVPKESVLDQSDILIEEK